MYSGMGNLHHNSLPACQLQRLQNNVNNLYSNFETPVPFWIDTICVPIQQPARNEAILNMRKVYRWANKVLVLDQVLSQVSRESDPVDLFMRIRASAWVRRLWTSREAQLAQSRYYQFEGSALTSAEIYELYDSRRKLADQDQRSRDASDPVIGLSGEWDRPSDEQDQNSLRINNLDILVQSNLSWIPDIERLYSHQNSAVRLAWTSALMRWRRTSRSADETICLAGIWERRVDDLLELSDPSQRMKRLIGNLDEVPKDILFTDRPRIQDDHFRWIPTTFLGGEGGLSLMDPAQRAYPSPLGLRGRFPCFFLAPESRIRGIRRPDGRESIFVGQKGKKFLGQPYPHPSGECIWEVSDLDGSEDLVHWDDCIHRENAVIMQRPFDGSTENGITAILVTVTRRRMGIIYCRYERRLTITLLSKEVYNTNDLELVPSAMHPLGKMFCIG